MHHRIQLTVGDVTMSGWKPTIRMIPPLLQPSVPLPSFLLQFCCFVPSCTVLFSLSWVIVPVMSYFSLLWVIVPVMSYFPWRELLFLSWVIFPVMSYFPCHKLFFYAMSPCHEIFSLTWVISPVMSYFSMPWVIVPVIKLFSLSWVVFGTIQSAWQCNLSMSKLPKLLD